MEIRVLTTKYLTCILATIALSVAQTLISKDTTWSDDLILRKSVIVSENATLTIKDGVSVFIDYVDTDKDEVGDIEISVFGSININGTHESMVAIKPVQNTVNKSYWKGITIHESTSISIVEFLKLSNAQTGLNIKSKLRARGLSLDNCGSIGINIESTLSD
jgi:hypothetical protein